MRVHDLPSLSPRSLASLDHTRHFPCPNLRIATVGTRIDEEGLTCVLTMMELVCSEKGPRKLEVKCMAAAPRKMRATSRNVRGRERPMVVDVGAGRVRKGEWAERRV